MRQGFGDFRGFRLRGFAITPKKLNVLRCVHIVEILNNDLIIVALTQLSNNFFLHRTPETWLSSAPSKARCFFAVGWPLE